MMKQNWISTNQRRNSENKNLCQGFKTRKGITQFTVHALLNGQTKIGIIGKRVSDKKGS